MPLINRVLDAEPLTSLNAYRAAGGGDALFVLQEVGPDAVLDAVEASGLRGRGGAGFPTGTKWRTVVANRTSALPTTVVVNGAEGEPGSFKDRELVRRNPYRIIEGAVIAARVLGADRIIVALKASFTVEVDLVRGAIAECRDAGWLDDLDAEVLEGPGEYLFGEETGLLEVLAGRQPFPRTIPPYRQGADGVGTDTASAAGTVMAGPDGAKVAPPTLVNNVETLANVPLIVAHGPEWYREVGTQDSPGTIVCTVTGDTAHAGVGEVPMGTPVRSIVDMIGGGLPEDRSVLGVLSGVSHPMLPGEALDTPASHEDLQRAGAGLGAGGFIVFDDQRDPIAIAAGVSRFLAVESCGQCEPCKQDGLELADLIDRLRRGDAPSDTRSRLGGLLETVTNEARCFLAHQQQAVGASVFTLFEERAVELLEGRGEPGQAVSVTPIVELSDEVVQLDDTWQTKQPDWTHGTRDSGQAPADRYDQRHGGS